MNQPVSAASVSPAEMKEQAKARQAKLHDEYIKARQRRAIALARVLGQANERSPDQKLVWEYLTGEAFSIPASYDTNQMLVFEGQRRRAAEIIVLVEEARTISHD